MCVGCQCDVLFPPYNIIIIIINKPVINNSDVILQIIDTIFNSRTNQGQLLEMADDNTKKLAELLGIKFLSEITRINIEEVEQNATSVVVEDTSKSPTTTPPATANCNNQLTNAKEITCECKTVILKPDTAKLIIPSEAMLALEKNLNLQHPSQKTFGNLKRGCYWLVDDMYKFEQIGYTKEVKPQRQELSHSETEQEPQQQQAPPPTDLTTVNGLRYLVCAECNLCPLGWFDPTTKESYLYVW